MTPLEGERGLFVRIDLPSSAASGRLPSRGGKAASRPA